MSIVLMIYLASISSSIKAILGFTSTMLFICCLIISICVYVSDNRLMFKKTIIASFIGILISAMIPTKETIYMMAGASIAKDIAENPKVVDTMDKVYKLVNKELDDRLNKKEK